MKDNRFFLKKIIWYDIDERGYIKVPLKNQAAVYVYMKTGNKIQFYVGSSVGLASRISSHRSRVIN